MNALFKGLIATACIAVIIGFGDLAWVQYKEHQAAERKAAIASWSKRTVDRTRVALVRDVCVSARDALSRGADATKVDNALSPLTTLKNCIAIGIVPSIEAD